MTTTDAPLCVAYDQIGGRKCRYYADHGGQHNFARLDHNSVLERDLRRELDQMTKGLTDALRLFASAWCPEHGHTPTPEEFMRADELGKLIGQERPLYDEIAVACRRRS